MDHIIDNLLSNALKYTEKGVIHILVKTARKKATIEEGYGYRHSERGAGQYFHEYYRYSRMLNFMRTGSGIGLIDYAPHCETASRHYLFQ